MPVKTVLRADAIDREQFKAMVEGPPFGRLVERVEAELERHRLLCERAGDIPAVRRAQGAAAALRTVLALPAQMLAEMSSRGE